MPSLSIPNTFSSGTIISSSQVNANFAAITTLLNTTKLDDDNIQNVGITRATKLKTGTNWAVVINNGSGQMTDLTPGTNGYLLASGGVSATPQWVPSSATLENAAIVGSAAQVTAGSATHSSIVSAIAAVSAGAQILVLSTYTGTENITFDKQLVIKGQGHSSIITGTVTFDSSSDFSRLTNIKVTDNITLSAGADGVEVDSIWLATGKSFLVDSTVAGEYLQAIVE